MSDPGSTQLVPPGTTEVDLRNGAAPTPNSASSPEHPSCRTAQPHPGRKRTFLSQRRGGNIASCASFFNGGNHIANVTLLKERAMCRSALQNAVHIGFHAVRAQGYPKLQKKERRRPIGGLQASGGATGHGVGVGPRRQGSTTRQLREACGGCRPREETT